MLIINNQPQNNSTRRFFPLPYEVFCLGLSAGAIAVYAYLMSCENRVTYECYPSYGTIGHAINMSDNTVKKYVDELRDKHLIDTEPTKVKWKNGRKYNGNLLYHIRPISEAVDYYQEVQLRIAEQQARAKRAKILLEEYDKKHPRNTTKSSDAPQS